MHMNISIYMNIINKLIVEFTSRYIRHELDSDYCEYCMYKSYYCKCQDMNTTDIED